MEPGYNCLHFNLLIVRGEWKGMGSQVIRISDINSGFLKFGAELRFLHLMAPIHDVILFNSIIGTLCFNTCSVYVYCVRVAKKYTHGWLFRRKGNYLLATRTRTCTRYTYYNARSLIFPQKRMWVPFIMFIVQSTNITLTRSIILLNSVDYHGIIRIRARAGSCVVPVPQARMRIQWLSNKLWIPVQY